MIISHSRKFIFVKTYKTAGSSLEIALSKYCAKGDILTPLDGEEEAQRRALSGLGRAELRQSGAALPDRGAGAAPAPAQARRALQRAFRRLADPPDDRRRDLGRATSPSPSCAIPSTAASAASTIPRTSTKTAAGRRPGTSRTSTSTCATIPGSSTRTGRCTPRPTRCWSTSSSATSISRRISPRSAARIGLERNVYDDMKAISAKQRPAARRPPARSARLSAAGRRMVGAPLRPGDRDVRLHRRRLRRAGPADRPPNLIARGRRVRISGPYPYGFWSAFARRAVRAPRQAATSAAKRAS